MEPWNARLFFVMISATVFLAVVIDFFGVHTVHVLYWSQALQEWCLLPIFAYILLLPIIPESCAPPTAALKISGWAAPCRAC